MEIRVVKSHFRPFREIVIGDVFLYNNEHYMRTESSSDWGVNAVNVFTGELTFFNQADPVIPEDNPGFSSLSRKFLSRALPVIYRNFF